MFAASAAADVPATRLNPRKGKPEGESPMQTWAKRGIQTALVTGGLLMLGTGIASADEDVNPDKPASPLDGSLSIPVNIQNNSIGSPLGQLDVPNVSREVK